MPTKNKKKIPVIVTTKTGDAGETALASGQRLAKDAPVFEVIGTLDELNSWLGLLATQLDAAHEKQQALVYTIQETLFYIGAEIAEAPKTKLLPSAITQLETASNKLLKTMEDDWHTKFLLPGGTTLGAHCDIARTVCRRAERTLVSYSRTRPVSNTIQKYLNRLSDYLYVLRCFVNLAAEYKERQFISKR